MKHTIQHNILLEGSERDIKYEILYEFEKQGFTVHSTNIPSCNQISIYCWKECKNIMEVFKCTQRI